MGLGAAASLTLGHALADAYGWAEDAGPAILPMVRQS
jgi:hypothetical protein